MNRRNYSNVIISKQGKIAWENELSEYLDNYV